MATISDISSVPYSGDLRADALLDKTVPNWNYLLPTRTTLYYTFDCSLGSVIDQATSELLTAFNATQKAAAASILSYVCSLTGLSFSETASGASADFHFGAINISGASTSGLCRSTSGYSYTSGEVLTSYTAEAYIYLDNVEFASSNANPTAGSSGYETLLHEIGHALGLSHPFDGTYKLPAAQDNTNNTVMSYTRAGGSKSTFQSYDQLALTWIYGNDGLGGSYGYNSTNGPSLTLGTGTDTTAPTVTTFSPADEAAGIAIASNIVLTFSENIARGTGNIVLKNATGTIIATYDAATSSNLTINGSTLTINPTADLAYSTGYKVELASGSVKDLAGNSYVGTTTYNFTTVAAPDLTPPVAPKLITSAGFNFLIDPQVTMQTTLGTVVFELNPEQAPVTVANMLAYVNSAFYDNTLFHRVIPGFMVQGGGLTTGLASKPPTYSAIALESNNGLSNLRGSIAMARTSVADSATTQFFVNQVDNIFLDYSSAASPGYAVFGKVMSGLSVIDSIAQVATTTVGPYANVPITDITITSLRQTLAGSSITNVSTLTVSDLEAGAQWLYSLDGAVTWTAGTGNSFTVPAGNYAAGVIQVKQIDIAGNVSTSNGMLTSALVVDTTVPTVITFSPADEASGIAIASDIVLTFNEAIARGTGNIVLKNAADTIIATYDAATSSNLTISGSTLTINPTADLGYSTGYKVEFAAGSVKDIAGNSYAGTTSYNFTTVANSGSNQSGTTGNDSFTSTTGNQSFDGGGGFDIATFSGNRSNYTITKTGSTFTVSAITGTDGTDTVTNVEYLQFADKAITISPANTFDEYTALLYQGALGRTPDSGGLAGWITLTTALPAATQAMGVYGLSDASGNFNGNMSITSGFTQSAEFIAKYGSLTNEQFVTQLYANILDRTPDAAGLAGWQSILTGGATREHLLVGFALSTEAISNATVGYVGIHGQHDAWLMLS